jgi:hypothetical protein
MAIQYFIVIKKGGWQPPLFLFFRLNRYRSIAVELCQQVCVESAYRCWDSMFMQLLDEPLYLRSGQWLRVGDETPS